MYALGITLFEMTFGRYPYSQSTTIQQQFEVHRSSEILFPDPWPTEIPEGWKGVLSRLMAKEPESRFADYVDVQADIRRFQPLARVSAAVVPRGLAWLIDLLLLALAMALIDSAQPRLAAVPLGLSEATIGWIAGMTVTLIQILIFGLLVFAHVRARTTPGKWLFQLSISDRHGLPCAPARLVPRFVLSQFPISSSLIFNVAEQVVGGHAPWLAASDAILSALWFIAVVVSLLIDKQRRALHDRFLGTRVVVDHVA
jgi:hypothetical protein